MQRRDSSGQPVKGQSANRPKARNAPTAQVSTADLQEQLDRAKRERDEALEQLAATSEVLHIIGSSFGELKLVFRTMLEKATTLCEATFGNMYLRKGDVFELAATYNSPSALVEERARAPYILKAGSASAPDRIVRTKSVVHIVDLASSEFYLSREPRAVAGVELGGVRTLLLVPMLKDNEVVGYFAIFRQEVKPFTERQIELVKNFAAQAVIAIENTRLLNELRQRTDDLTESLEQQTATSEILEVISNSPTDTQPVFDAIVRSGLNLFPDAVVTISLPDRDLIKLGAIGGVDEAGVEALRGRFPMPLSREFITGTAILDQREIDIANAHEPPNELRAGAQNLLAGGYSAMTVLPMVRGDETIGTLNVVRRIPGPFPTSSGNFCAPSPIKPLSPSRIRGCSMSCAIAPMIFRNRWSSRPRPRRC